MYFSPFLRTITMYLIHVFTSLLGTVAMTVTVKKMQMIDDSCVTVNRVECHCVGNQTISLFYFESVSNVYDQIQWEMSFSILE